MTAIRYVTGNLLETELPIIMQGCNAQGRMGSGLALSIRIKFPWAYEIYVDAHQRAGLRLGEIVWAIHESGKPIIGNAITQEFYGRDQKLYVNYEAVRLCLKEVERFIVATQGDQPDLDIASIRAVTQVGFPLIGAGLGGGKWSIISKIIEEESHSFTPVVYLMDGVIPED